jgi:hypothetical protein
LAQGAALRLEIIFVLAPLSQFCLCDYPSLLSFPRKKAAARLCVFHSLRIDRSDPFRFLLGESTPRSAKYSQSLSI